MWTARRGCGCRLIGRSQCRSGGGKRKSKQKQSSSKRQRHNTCLNIRAHFRKATVATLRLSFRTGPRSRRHYSEVRLYMTTIIKSCPHQGYKKFENGLSISVPGGGVEVTNIFLGNICEKYDNRSFKIRHKNLTWGSDLRRKPYRREGGTLQGLASRFLWIYPSRCLLCRETKSCVSPSCKVVNH